MVIFINGTINSGKSTVSKILAKKLGKTVVLEIDVLRSFFHWMPLTESIPINIDNACLLIKNFVKNKLNVIVPYPISQKNYERIINQLKNLNTELKFITLNPRLDIVTKNRGNRKLTNDEVERIKYHYKIGINQPSFGIIIDNSNQTPEETVKEVLKLVYL